MTSSISDKQAMLQQQSKRRKLSPAQHLLASATAGAVARVCTHPLDTIRVRTQALQGERSGGRTGVAAAAAAATDTRSVTTLSSSVSATSSATSSASSSLLSTISLVRRLYSGMWLAAAMQAPALALYLTSYDMTKSWLSENGRFRSTFSTHVAAALTAELVSGFVWTPMEIVKQHLQVHSLSSSWSPSPGIGASKTLAIFKSILATDGVAGLFRGYTIGLAVFVPYTITYFSTYEELKRILQPIFQERRKPDFQKVEGSPDIGACITAAATAGAIASIISNPLEIVKVRYQLQHSNMSVSLLSDGVGVSSIGIHSNSMKADVASSRRFLTAIPEIIRDLRRTQGPMWFTCGMFARIACTMPSVAVSMGMYEYLKNLIAR